MKNTQEILAEWASAGIAKSGKSKGGLARALGVSAPVVTRILDGSRRIQIAELPIIAEYIGEPIPVSSVDDPNDERKDVLTVRSVPVVGEVAASVWLETDYFVNGDSPFVPAVPGRYEHLDQFAFKVIGPSMDLKRITHGDFLICVRYFEARTALTNGDIVVVERRRDQLVERTCKELYVFKDRYELRPKSSDARYQAPIIVKNDADCDKLGHQVEIIGLVIGLFSHI